MRRKYDNNRSLYRNAAAHAKATVSAFALPTLSVAVPHSSFAIRTYKSEKQIHHFLKRNFEYNQLPPLCFGSTTEKVFINNYQTTE